MPKHKADDEPAPDAEQAPADDDEQAAEDADAELRADPEAAAPPDTEDEVDATEEPKKRSSRRRSAPAGPELVIDHHGRPILPGTTYTASYTFDDEGSVDPGAGETDLVFELDTPRGLRTFPAVRDGRQETVFVTFPVEFEGDYKARLMDGETTLASLDFSTV
jgi:hypothetical protein